MKKNNNRESLEIRYADSHGTAADTALKPDERAAARADNPLEISKFHPGATGTACADACGGRFPQDAQESRSEEDFKIKIIVIVRRDKI